MLKVSRQLQGDVGPIGLSSADSLTVSSRNVHTLSPFACTALQAISAI